MLKELLSYRRKNSFFLYSLLSLLFISQAASSQIQFTEVAASAGITGSLNNTSVAFVDIDGDGFSDIYTTYATGAASNQSGARYYKNNGNGTFTLQTNLTALPASSVIYTGILADYDNDYDLDIFTGGDHVSKLFRNDGELGFTDVSSATGISGISVHIFGASWLDYNLDGYIDLFLATLSTNTHILLKNNQNGTFSNATDEMNLDVTSSTNARGLAIADYDRDGDPDIFVANTNQANHFFRNDRSQFTEIAGSLGLQFSTTPNTHAQFSDYDNDGDFDLFIGYAGGGFPHLMRNENNGLSFTNVTSSAGFPSVTCNGSTFCDMDNDGDLDLIGIGVNSDFFGIMRNNGNGTFTNVTSGSGLLATNSVTAVASADYDLDGRLDIYAATLYDAKEELYHNTTNNSNNWIGFRLYGVFSNTSAIGAIIDLYAGGLHMTRQVDGGHCFMGQDDLTQHFGLGTATTVDSVVIHWPSGNRTEVVPDAVNEYTNVFEDESINIESPQLQSAVSSNPFEVFLQWSSTKNNAKFRIYRSNSSEFGYVKIAESDIGTLSYVDTSAAPNTTYYYKVSAFIGFLNSSLSNELSVTTQSIISPIVNAASVISEVEIKLEWHSNMPNEPSRVYRSLVSGDGYQAIAEIPVPDSSYIDTTVVPGTTYYYRITTFHNMYESQPSNEFMLTTPALLSPSNLSVDIVSTTQIQLNWTKTNQDAYVRIYRSTTPGSNFVQIDSVKDIEQTYLNSNLNDNTTYFYRTAAAKRGHRSSYSNEVSGLTYSIAPVISSAAITSSSPYKVNINIAFSCMINGSTPKGILEFGKPNEVYGSEITLTRGGDNVYRGTIPANQVTKEGLWYRLRAENLADTVYYPISK